MRIHIIQLVAKDKTQGFGRDAEEALANSGMNDEAFRTAAVAEVEISDSPDTNDYLSVAAAEAVCRFHVESDEETPKPVREELRQLLSTKQFATAVQYCFDMIWDRGYENNLPPDARKYRI